MSDVLVERDWAAVETAYLAAEPPHVVLDDLVTTGVLSELAAELRGSHSWEFKAPGSRELYLRRPGARIMHAIADGLCERLPTLLRGLALVDDWAYLHLQDAGIDFHTDGGRVTLNLYLTDDRYNLTPGRGGLQLTPVRRPAELSPVEYSTPPWSTQYFARHHDGDVVRVPHRCNRAVLFDARLYHASDEMVFARSGTESIRLNVGLLFDDPVEAHRRRDEFDRRLAVVLADFETQQLDPRMQPLEAVEAAWARAEVRSTRAAAEP